MRTRVKICGITRVEDARAAVAAGADALGLVFHADSPRHIEPEAARAVAAAVPAFVTLVGLFVDPAPEQVRQALSAVPLDLLQFHGQEPAQQCRAYGRRYIKALRMVPGLDVDAAARVYPDAAGLLLDAYRPGVAGGSGETFDWTRVPRDLPLPLILAGGLTPDNVGDAVRTLRPYAVDVSSGVERAKGIKDATLIEAFMRRVAEADRGHSRFGL